MTAEKACAIIYISYHKLAAVASGNPEERWHWNSREYCIIVCPDSRESIENRYGSQGYMRAVLYAFSINVPG